MKARMLDGPFSCMGWRMGEGEAVKDSFEHWYVRATDEQAEAFMREHGIAPAMAGAEFWMRYWAGLEAERVTRRDTVIEWSMRTSGKCLTLDEVPAGATIEAINGRAVLTECEGCHRTIFDGEEYASAEDADLCAECMKSCAEDDGSKAP